MGRVLIYGGALLSLWMFIHWLWRSSAGKSAGRSGLCGVLCTMSLLFPVISADDDLLQRELWNAPAPPILNSTSILRVVMGGCCFSSLPASCAALILGFLNMSPGGRICDAC